jgi:mRNA-degrading endonuclease toxin of MazEF toxin-antitoxin module
MEVYIKMLAGKAAQHLESIIMAYQIRTISKRRLGRMLGYLDDAGLLLDVLAAIKHLDME